MLALNRGIGKKVMIGDHVMVEILKVTKDAVLLSIQVPEGVSVKKENGDQIEERGLIFEVSCKASEQVFIDKRVKLEILEIRVRDREIRIGIVAPKEIPIFRHEVYVRIKQEQAEHSDVHQMT